MPVKKTKNLYAKVCHLSNLARAWEVVRKNGLNSRSDISKKQIRDFENGIRKKLQHIQAQLKSKTFRFSLARGVPIPREGKDDRPLVVSPIENRIVQRAILQVLQSEEGIRKHLHVSTSFGGIEDRGVKDALKLIALKISKGAEYFVRSDIKSFFTKIPKEEVLEIIFKSISVRDEHFENLLSNAIRTELENLDSLGEKASLFPLDDTGVAQGSCLSPLLGNIFLSEFDSISNSDDVTCIRFVDDYVILGPDLKSVKAKLLKGKDHLNQRGLEIYDPFGSSEKGKNGKVLGGFEFLGCDISPGRISPSTKSIENLKEKVQQRISKSFHPTQNTTYAETLNGLKNTVYGWGNSYSFCNNQNLISSLDKWLINEIVRFHKNYIKNLEKIADPGSLVQMLGVSPLISCKHDPIYMDKKLQKK